jgi:hypothetical protein
MNALVKIFCMCGSDEDAGGAGLTTQNGAFFGCVPRDAAKPNFNRFGA